MFRNSLKISYGNWTTHKSGRFLRKSWTSKPKDLQIDKSKKNNYPVNIDKINDWKKCKMNKNIFLL